MPKSVLPEVACRVDLDTTTIGLSWWGLICFSWYLLLYNLKDTLYSGLPVVHSSNAVVISKQFGWCRVYSRTLGDERPFYYFPLLWIRPFRRLSRRRTLWCPFEKTRCCYYWKCFPRVVTLNTNPLNYQLSSVRLCVWGHQLRVGINRLWLSSCLRSSVLKTAVIFAFARALINSLETRSVYYILNSI